MRKMYLLPVLCAAVAISGCSGAEDSEPVKFSGQPMGSASGSEIVPASEIEVDPEHAVIALEYYLNEARNGSAYAQLTVGETYLQGELFPVNHIEAYAWLATAQSQGITEASTLMDIAWEAMDEEARSYATALGDYYTGEFGLEPDTAN